MQEKVKIIADSTCDLSPELVEQYHIHILPLHIMLGEEEIADGPELDIRDIFAWADAHKTTPKTSAPSEEDAIKLMQALLAEEGSSLVCFSISKSMSSSYNIMRLAAENLNAEDRVHVIDSGNLSTGIGLLVIHAAEMAAAGHTAAEIAAEAEALKPFVRASFTVDTLTYLHRGGRCSGLAAMMGGALHLHPEIYVKDGAMHTGRKYRGKLPLAIRAYVADRKEYLLKALPGHVFITHSRCNPEIVDEVRKTLEDLHYFTKIHETYSGGVVSSHCGPGTLGVLFIADPKA